MNKALLQVNTSLFSDAGQSSTLANEFVAGWKKRNPGAAVIKRDLATEPVPHLTAERFQAFITKPFDTQSAYLKKLPRPHRNYQGGIRLCRRHCDGRNGQRRRDGAGEKGDCAVERAD